MRKRTDMKSTLKKIVCITLALVLSMGVMLSLSSCGKYKEDTSTERKDTYYVLMEIKDYGNIIVKLDAVAAPATVANFVKLVREDFYDGLTFHRVMSNFMIQGGCPRGDGTGSSSQKIPGEMANNLYFGNYIKHERGVISMARPGGNYDGASCQFFICNSNSPSVKALDDEYAAFGHVIEGMDIVDKITADTASYGLYNNGAISDKTKQVVIKEMTVILYEE